MESDKQSSSLTILRNTEDNGIWAYIFGAAVIVVDSVIVNMDKIVLAFRFIAKSMYLLVVISVNSTGSPTDGSTNRVGNLFL